MSTQYLSIRGLTKWAQVYEPDVAFGGENYKINIYPINGDEWDKFNKTGLQLTPKKDDTADPILGGKSFITLRRPTKKLIRDDLVMFSPPEISGKVNVSYVNSEGEKVRQYNKGDKVSVKRVDGEGTEITGKISFEENESFVIPNGSTVIVNFSYYDTAKGKGHRLESIRVLELAEYTPAITEDKPIEIIEPGVEAGVKKEKKLTKQKEETSSVEDMSDEIPW